MDEWQRMTGKPGRERAQRQRTSGQLLFTTDYHAGDRATQLRRKQQRGAQVSKWSICFGLLLCNILVTTHNMPSALPNVTRCWCTSSPETEMGFAVSHRKHQQSFVYLKRIWDQQLWAALWTYYPPCPFTEPSARKTTWNLRFERLKR